MKRTSFLRWTAWAAGVSVAAVAAAQDAGGQPPEQPEEERRQSEEVPEAGLEQPQPIEIVPVAPTPPPSPPPREPETQVGGFHLNFRDGVDLNVLVDYIAKELGLQIIIEDGNLLGQKVFLPTPIQVPEDQVLRLLNMLLEQKGFTLRRDSGTGIYFISQIGDVPSAIGPDPFNTTRMIPTPGIRPSSLAQAINSLGFPVVQGNAAGSQRQPGQAIVSYLDDLSLILISGSARQIAAVEAVVQRLVHEQSLIGFERIELRYVAASYARERILELEGIAAGAPRVPGRVAPGANVAGQASPAGFGGSSLLNLEDRLTVDPQGNALLFRGRPDESAELMRRLKIVDVPNALISRWYGVGRAASAVAQEGSRQALGDVTVEQGGLLDASSQFARSGMAVQGVGQVGGQRGIGGLQGTGFVVFPEAGGFVYRGTEQQHQQVQRLIDSLSELTSAELVVVEFYKLRHADSVKVAEIINNILTNQQGTGSSDLIGRDLARGGARDRRRTNASPLIQSQQSQEGEGQGERALGADGGDGEISAVRATEDTFVLADEANNQVVVKAPKRLQPQFARLIERLDLRRPQVYIDAKIVAVTGSDDFRMAFETQIIAGQFGLNTDFGLGQPGQTILDPKRVPGSVGPFNLTAAVVRSDFVPVLLSVLQSTNNSRILSMPQLLVDDNEEAEVISVNREPYGAISRDPGAGDIITQGGEAEAGTTLRVKPQISEGGYLNLQYEIELSSFTGEPREGLGPPSQVNNIRSDSVTVPSDTTIVVGGLTFTSDVNTVFKIPLLGDIPLVGHLFRDTSTSKTTTTLYIFITPTIMRDPNFADLRLLTRGPAAEAGIAADLPHAGPVRIDILDRSSRPLAPPPMLEDPSTPGRSEEQPVGATPRRWVPPSRSGGASSEETR